eukprot:gnl/MRDRNA2_/MRDRNA2_29809_c0_seq1.p1 gnl/MRDRNA2_/MRDRNA2_29809_c0~~gnl/MRDRNA2_/MRDRNA2_29809_c0_seq1.p1  ORF type:complete len:583 (+),score=105.60 gnl/MRDRNA2_/MRDRNA2_29809_c0_seq1:124-1749(+)
MADTAFTASILTGLKDAVEAAIPELAEIVVNISLEKFTLSDPARRLSASASRWLTVTTGISQSHVKHDSSALKHKTMIANFTQNSIGIRQSHVKNNSSAPNNETMVASVIQNSISMNQRHVNNTTYTERSQRFLKPLKVLKSLKVDYAIEIPPGVNAASLGKTLANKDIFESTMASSYAAAYEANTGKPPPGFAGVKASPTMAITTPSPTLVVTTTPGYVLNGAQENDPVDAAGGGEIHKDEGGISIIIIGMIIFVAWCCCCSAGAVLYRLKRKQGSEPVSPDLVGIKSKAKMYREERKEKREPIKEIIRKAQVYMRKKIETCEAIKGKAKTERFEVMYDNAKEGERSTWPAIIRACNQANPDKKLVPQDRIVGITADGWSVLTARITLVVTLVQENYRNKLTVVHSEDGTVEDVDLVLDALKEKKSFQLKIDRGTGATERSKGIKKNVATVHGTSAANGSSDPDVRKMSVKQLKEFLASKAVDCSDCIEKGDLLKRALEVDPRSREKPAGEILDAPELMSQARTPQNYINDENGSIMELD